MFLSELKLDIALISPTVPIEISSSEIRNMIKIGKDVSEFVPDRVIDYIKGNNLYVS